MKKWLWTIACAVAASACAAPQSSPPPSNPLADGRGKCNPVNVHVHLGSVLTQELGAQVLGETGSAILRLVAPGSPVTKDYRTDRVSIYYDDQKIITDIRCG